MPRWVNFIGCSGSTMERAPVSGKMFGTPASSCWTSMALFIGVPMPSSIRKTLSRLISLLAAWMARGT
jgi:hypothetical protein